MEETTMEVKKKPARIPQGAIWKGNYYRVNGCTKIQTSDLAKAYIDLGIQEFGGGGTLRWINRDRSFTRKKDGICVSKKRCTFHYSANCPFIVRELLNTRTMSATIEIGAIAHTDHMLHRKSVLLQSRPGLPKYIAGILFSSPGKIKLPLSEIRTQARGLGVTVTETMANTIKRKRIRLRTQLNRLEEGQS